MSMVFITLFLSAGMLSGFLLRKREKALYAAEKITTGIILILLFLLGLSLGMNKTVLNNLSRVGIQSALISAGGVSGSVFVSFFVYKYFFKEKNNEK